LTLCKNRYKINFGSLFGWWSLEETVKWGGMNMTKSLVTPSVAKMEDQPTPNCVCCEKPIPSKRAEFLAQQQRPKTCIGCQQAAESGTLPDHHQHLLERAHDLLMA